VIDDWMQRRLTLWSLEGTLVGAVPAAGALRGALPRARGTDGAWYFQLPPVAGPDGSGNRDSTALVRTDAGLGRADTIGALAPFELAEVISEGRRRLERRLLSGQDSWGVLPDGTLWVARIGDNRVDWRSPDGKWIHGRPLPDRVLPVTQNDRDIFLNHFEATLRPTVEQIPFVIIKPPFEAGHAAPDGRVWLTKNRAVGDSLREYQIVDQQGDLVATAHHPGLGQLLGLGGGFALVGEPFAGGVRLLLFEIVSPAGT
jgi:hypothetical protein